MEQPVDTLVNRALWFIESHFARDISLDEVAAVCGLSRFQMSRLFSDAMGMPLTQYARGRRLTEAARALAGGAADILAVALEAGYGSHEAFTRAFRDQFGLTPAELRQRGDLGGVALIEPERHDTPRRVQLPPPRIERHGPLSLAGLAERFPVTTLAGIPALWQRFHPHIGHIPQQIAGATYGVCLDMAPNGDSFQYLAAVEVAELSAIGIELTGLRLPAQRYAVFASTDHITAIAATVRTVLRDWLPGSGERTGDMPDLMERYGASFNPRTGAGGFELWLPLKPQPR